jgi:adenylosuccinate synthase
MIAPFTKPCHASVLIDGQFGSTGKGLIAAYLAQLNDCDIATTNASANAGHTTVIGKRKFVCFHTPTFAAINHSAKVYLNAGAIIDPDVLLKEVEEFGLAHRLVIHPHAAIITDACREFEKDKTSGAAKIASTQKGVGAAQMAKISRKGPVAKDISSISRWIGTMDLNKQMGLGARVVVEVPQGFGLSVNSGFWPYTTCREVSVSQALADAAIHPSFLGYTMMTARTHPIRVGNLIDKETGKEIGYSGPVYNDQKEHTWEELGREPELTTVTKRIRRIFSWSDQQYQHSLSMLRPDYVALTFCDYMPSADKLWELVRRMTQAGKVPTLLSCGPDVADVYTTSAIDDMAMRLFAQGGAK